MIVTTQRLPYQAVLIAAAEGLDPALLDRHACAEHGVEELDPGYAQECAASVACVRHGRCLRLRRGPDGRLHRDPTIAT